MSDDPERLGMYYLRAGTALVRVAAVFHVFW
jgi:hypothetical protein